MKKLILAGMMLAAGFGLSQVQAQESGCETTGTVVFHDIPATLNDVLPSVKRQLTGLGRLALGNNCSVVITCVSDPTLGKGAGIARTRNCNIVMGTLTKFETRGPVRRRLMDGYKQVKVAPGSEYDAGAVYVSLE